MNKYNYLFVVKGDMNKADYRSFTYVINENQLTKLHRIIELINEAVDYVSKQEQTHLCNYRFSDEYEQLCDDLHIWLPLMYEESGIHSIEEMTIYEINKIIYEWKTY